MAERSYNGRNIYTSLIDDATGDIARTSSGYIEADTYKLYANVIASGVSAEFDSSVVRSNRLSLKLSTTNATGRARAGFAASATSGGLVTVSDMAYLPKAKPVSTYNFSIWAKTNNVTTNGCYVTVASTSGNGTTTFVMLTTTKLTGTNDWTELSGQFTTRQDTAALRVIFFNDVAGNVSDAWFDVGSMQITEVLPDRTTATSRSTATNRVAVRDMGTALRFDGVNDIVSTLYDLPSGQSYTFSGWANRRTKTGNNALCGTDNGANGMAIYLTTETFAFRPNVGGTAATTFAVNPKLNSWFHWAITYDRINADLYINGVLISSNPYTVDFLNNQNFVIGKFGGGGAYFWPGLLDEQRIWLRILSADEIQNLYLYNIVPQDGLVAEYLFDEASGTTALDTSGNGNDGTITGATYTTDVPLRPRTSV